MIEYEYSKSRSNYQWKPPKNGNIAILAQKLTEGVEANGGTVEQIILQNLKIAPCNACDACIGKKSKGCVINDDMQSLYPKLKETDSIVFATPTYWFNMSAQMKLFIDRIYAVRDQGNYAFYQKKVGILMTYADVDENSSGAINAIRSFQDMCEFVEAEK